MNRLTTIALLSLVAGCSQKDEAPALPSWGYLPEMGASYWDRAEHCSNTIYPHIPFGVFDIGDSLHPVGKPATGVSRQTYLGQTCALASVSTTVYETPEDQRNNHYTISVEIPQTDDRCSMDTRPDFCEHNPISYLVIFRRDLSNELVGQTFRHKKMEDVISFDTDTNRVVFEVGSEKYDYRLPNL